MLQTECGNTPNEIRDMTLLDIQRLSRYWKKHPPLTVLVAGCAAALGITFAKSEEKNYIQSPEQAAAVLRGLNRMASRNG
jgi:hypothetical protein